jgi:hypothetical protein
MSPVRASLEHYFLEVTGEAVAGSSAVST